jgi:hypothetical protein
MPGSNFGDLYKRRLKETLKNLDVDKFEADLNREWTPEQWYQELKKRWYFHPYSWYMLQETVELTPEEHNLLCNGHTGCIPECRFYEPEGKIEPEELQLMITTLEKFVEWKQRPCDPKTCKSARHKHELQLQQQQQNQEKEEESNKNNNV